jgi:tRNA G10  N-methylase Trm11
MVDLPSPSAPSEASGTSQDVDNEEAAIAATTSIALFSNKKYDEYVVSALAVPCVYYIPSIVDNPATVMTWYNDLHDTIPWTKTSKINRWVALLETNPNNAYQYRDAPPPTSTATDSSSSSSSSLPFPATIRNIQRIVETIYTQLTGTTVQFNTCLANFYETGQQSIGWHTDREEIGRTTPIASVSLGATRQFAIRHKVHGMTDRTTLELSSGSVVFMENKCQQEYLHCIPKQSNSTTGRINLTFRCKPAGSTLTAGEREHVRRDTWLQNLQQEQANSTANTTTTTVEATLPDATATAPTDNTFPGRLWGDDIPTHTTTTIDYSTLQIQYTLSCNIGTEGPTAAEALEILSADNDSAADGSGTGTTVWNAIASPFGVRGYVALCTTTSDQTNAQDNEDNDNTNEKKMHYIKTVVPSLLLQLRSVLHVMQYHDHFTLEEVVHATTSNKEEIATDVRKTTSQVDGESLYQFYKQRLEDNPRLITTLAMATSETPRTFRVTCERTGAHAFQAPTVEYEIGGAMSEVYTPYCTPQMKDYDIHIRVDVVCNHVMVGTQINVHDLSKRHFLRYRNAVTIKTNLAYVMLRYANFLPQICNDGGQGASVLVDPFCGSGTILLEALEVVASCKTCYHHNVNLKCVGLDVSRRSAQGATENAEAAGFPSSVCAFYTCDARAIRKHVQDESVDAIVTNMPWGVRTGHKQTVSDLQQLYEVFLRSAWYTLKPGGRVVMLVLRGLQMIRILRKLGGRYRILAVRIVRTTNNLPAIVVVEKLETDVLRDLVKQQLGQLSPFVNVSTEMYHAINYEDIDEAN